MQLLADEARRQIDPAISAAFEEKKKELSFKIDGHSGLHMPTFRLGTIPLFMNMVPTTIQAVSDEHNLDLRPINLYTGFGAEGFNSLSLKDPHAFGDESQPLTLYGCAKEAGASFVRFDVKASLIDDVYAGMSLIFTSGPGAHQKVQIVSYDGLELVANFEPSLASAPSAGSHYLIESNQQNHHIFSLDASTEVKIATHIWGADNFRSDLISRDSSPRYQCFTEEESVYRIDQDIEPTDFTPYTVAEKKLRRRLHLFDPDYGNLKNPENAARMCDILSQALDQIKTLTVKEKSRVACLEKLIPTHVLKREELITF